MNILTRKEAKEAGLKKYYTGKPCKHGHLCERRINGNCISCQIECTAKYFNNHPEYQKEYYLKNREKHLKRGAKWHRENRDSVQARTAKWQRDNPHKVSEYSARWAKKYPEKVATRTRNRVARKHNADGKHTQADINKLILLQGNRCASCKSRLEKKGKNKYHVDHIVSLINGGSNWPDNLQILCPTCNLKKNSKDPIEWANENGRLL